MTPLLATLLVGFGGVAVVFARLARRQLSYAPVPVRRPAISPVSRQPRDSLPD
jgi:hypothetical protein